MEHDKTFHFVIVCETRTLICPDGTKKTMERTDMENECYAEWKDMGVFYYKNTGRVWVQGQVPTYHFETLTEEDGVFVSKIE